MYQTQHPGKPPPPSRRRNKRHSQRLRTVEVTRGRSGYGFTISGQSPCILSCIVAGSPADLCGLKTGDYLISVNGQMISNSPHDDVVRLIGSSRGMLVLQIAENYNSSDSSEDEYQVRPKAKYGSKTKPRPVASRMVASADDLAAMSRHRHASQPSGNKYGPRPPRDHSLDYQRSGQRAASPGRDLDPMERYLRDINRGIENINPLQGWNSTSKLKNVSAHDGIIRYRNTSRPTKHTIITREARLGVGKSQSFPEGFPGNPGRPLPPTPLSEMNNGLQVHSEPRNKAGSGVVSLEDVSDLIDYAKAIVGYAGSIEMPHDNKLSSSRVQAIRGAIKRLRMEQKVHTLVLMELEDSGLKLVNQMCCTVAKYAPEKVAFAGVCPEDHRFFGVVTLHTSSPEEEDSESEQLVEVVGSSCHVFFVDPALCAHQLHAPKCKNFQCTFNPQTQTCAEFPTSAVSVVHSISLRYPNHERSQCVAEMEQLGAFVAVAVRRSSTDQEASTPASSKVCVVDMTSDDPCNLSSMSSPNTSRFSRAGFADSSAHPTPSRSDDLDETLSVNSADSSEFTHDLDSSCQSNIDYRSGCMDRLQVRAMPDPRGFQQDTESPLEQQNSAINLRRNLHRFMNGHPAYLDRCGSAFVTPQSSASKLSSQAIPPRDNQAMIKAAKLSMDPTHMSTLCETPNSKFPPRPSLMTPVQQGPVLDKPPIPKTPLHHIKERSKSTPPIIKSSYKSSGRRSADEDPNEKDTCSKFKPVGPEGQNQELCKPIEGMGSELSLKADSDDLTSWRSSDALEAQSESRGSKTARASDEETKGRVVSWAVSFDRLLQDSSGLAVFTHYLKKEYSEENIKFWKKCEEYQRTDSVQERATLGATIFRNFLSSSASEPVNVDSHSRSEADKALKKAADKNVFEQTQKQIYLLMKQDSYPRFLKSELYKQCIIAEMEGLPLPYPDEEETKPLGTSENALDPSNKKSMKKSKSSAAPVEGHEEKRRRSLLPWIRNKSEKKLTKAVTESELNQTTGSSSSSQLQCIKVILPDGMLTAMEFKDQKWTDALKSHCESNKLVLDLLVVTNSKKEPVSLQTDSCPVDELHLHKAVFFKLEMATRKVIGIKSLSGRTLKQALPPILASYGQKIDSKTVIHVAGTGVVLSEEANVSEFDGKHLVVQCLDDFKEWGGGSSQRGGIGKPPLPKSRPSLTKSSADKSMGHFFRELASGSIAFDDNGVWDPEVKPSKNQDSKNLGFLDFIRRNSIGDKSDEVHLKSNKTRKLSSHLQKLPSAGKKRLPLPPSDPPSVSITQSKKKGLNDDEERFLSLLSRTSKQMDDQRGLTPKDLELPDFLKVTPSTDEGGRLSRNSSLRRSTMHHSDSSINKAAEREQHTPQMLSCSQDALQLSMDASSSNSPSSDGDLSLNHSNKSFSSAGMVPSHEEAELYFSRTHDEPPSLKVRDSPRKFFPEIGTPSSSADHLNLTMTGRCSEDEECDITLIPPSSSSSSSRVESPAIPNAPTCPVSRNSSNSSYASSSQLSWRPGKHSSEDMSSAQDSEADADPVWAKRNMSTPSPTTHSLVLDPDLGEASSDAKYHMEPITVKSDHHRKYPVSAQVSFV